MKRNREDNFGFERVILKIDIQGSSHGCNITSNENVF